LGEPNLRHMIHYYVIFDTTQSVGLSKESQTISSGDHVKRWLWLTDAGTNSIGW